MLSLLLLLQVEMYQLVMGYFNCPSIKWHQFISQLHEIKFKRIQVPGILAESCFRVAGFEPETMSGISPDNYVSQHKVNIHWDMVEWVLKCFYNIAQVVSNTWNDFVEKTCLHSIKYNIRVLRAYQRRLQGAWNIHNLRNCHGDRIHKPIWRQFSSILRLREGLPPRPT